MTLPMPSLKLVALNIVTISVTFFAIKYPSLFTTEIAHQNVGYFEYECIRRPHQSSWGSWWHPERGWNGTHSGQQSGQGAGAITKNWNILYHLGGNGPWIEKKHNVIEGGIEVPEMCEVEQVHMMSRHAERYPTKKAACRMEKLMAKIKQSGITFEGDLAFVNDWELFWSDPSQIEQLTSTGPFSGTLGSFTTGVRLRTRYQHLIQTHTNFWASESQRVIDTAKYFASGFFGLDWNHTKTSTLNIIPEDFDMGANTLTPGDTCFKYLHDKEEGHSKGYNKIRQFISTYTPPIRQRLLAQNPGIEYADDEIYAMQEMCGFEITVRGSSPWCDVFSQDEFLSFKYARDILHYYRAGPGTKYAGVMGSLWVNATLNVMLEGPGAGPLFFSFVHDGDIAPMITFLGIITPDEHLPTTHIPHDRPWWKGQITPMGGRIIFELLSCRESGKYVRININDGITALPGCSSGPGSSCPLDEFAVLVARKGREFGEFKEVCGLGREAEEGITFLHQ